MEKNIRKIIEILGSDIIEIKGVKDGVFLKFSAIGEAGEDSISFCKYGGEKSKEILIQTKAKIILCSIDAVIPDKKGVTYILVKNPRLSFAKFLSYFFKETTDFKIHPTAIIGKKCVFGRVAIGPNVVIGDNVKIGDGTIIYPNVVIGDNVNIGKNAVIKSHATIGQRGFGFVFKENNMPEAILHIGSVAIGDNVEIGANDTIARGTLTNTVISDFVKIDDQVHVAHNVKIGARTILTAGAEISGSAVIGADCWLGPNCSIMNDIAIGDRALIGLGAVVVKSVAAGAVVAGNPAKIIKTR